MSDSKTMYDIACDHWLTGDWKAVKADKIAELGPGFYGRIIKALGDCDSELDNVVSIRVNQPAVHTFIENMKQHLFSRTTQKLREECFDAYCSIILDININQTSDFEEMLSA